MLFVLFPLFHSQLSKYTSAMYGEMPPAEKEAWNQRAESDKARFLHELSNYGGFYVETIYVFYFWSSCLICHASCHQSRPRDTT
jgi:hypothetical protein